MPASEGEGRKKPGRKGTGASAMLNVSMTPELKARIFEIAAEERRSASSLVFLVLQKWIEERDRAKSRDGGNA